MFANIHIVLKMFLFDMSDVNKPLFKHILVFNKDLRSSDLNVKDRYFTLRQMTSIKAALFPQIWIFIQLRRILQDLI